MSSSLVHAVVFRRSSAESCGIGVLVMHKIHNDKTEISQYLLVTQKQNADHQTYHAIEFI